MKLFQKINSSFVRILTSRYNLTIEELGRKKLFIVFLLLMILGLFIFGTFHFKNGLYKNGIIDYLLVFILTALIFVLRYLKNPMPIYRSVTALFLITLFYWVRTGGAQGYSSMWALLFPLFSFFLLGKKEGLTWSVLFLFIIIYLFINPYSYLPGYTYPAQYVSRYIFLFVMIFLFTYNYESVREKYKAAMETEIKGKEQAEIELRRHHHHLEDIVAERTLEIKKNSEELEASEKRYRLMADNVNDLIWATDMELNFTFISPSIKRLYGYTVEEAKNLPIDKWNTPESYAKLISTYLKEKEIIESEDPEIERPIILQLDQIKKDGTVIAVELKVSAIKNENGKPIGIVGITRDISDRIAMEQERDNIKEHLAQSQKMEALGTMVSGLAHDFNNFLSGIIGSFDLLSLVLKKENLKNKEHVEKYISLGMESSKRSAGLISQLLILSKRHEITLTPLDIKSSLNHIYELCRSSFPKSIELNFHCKESPLFIMGDIIQIDQVLLNLCINASHAMTTMRPHGEKHGGTLTVTAEKVKFDYIMKENFPETAGDVDYWIRIKIEDTGVGIDSKTKQKIFEPFFSTKNKDESSGLGLAISYNIIMKHGGLVNVYSEPGSGSSFSIYFPVYNENNEISSDVIDPEIIPGSGTVLIIDDERVILDIAEAFLEQCGYTVITADGADNGIETFRKNYSEISAVLVDLSMPEKSGLEVFQELKRINIDVKVILSSGMLDNELKEMAFKMGVKETVNKPYTSAELSMKMSKVINISI